METFSLEELIVVPWSSDSEWQLVRQYIYAGKDLQNYKQALRKLLLWKTRGRPLNRGLYCTELILQVISKDAYFCDVDVVVEENDLIRLYSMAIMKFVNVAADITGKGPQKSMYFRASNLELPSWLIDMRHKISHDQDLPNLESLRKAMEFLLKWLQTKYWNEENNFLVGEPKLTTSMVDVYTKMVDFYLLNQKRNSDLVLKNELSNYLKQHFDVPEFSYKISMLMMKKTLQNKHWSPQFINVFVTRYLTPAQECKEDKISKTDLDTWRVLLYYLIELGFLTNLLQCLVTENSHRAALWVIELCSLAFEIKRNVFSKPKQINSTNLPRKLVNFDSNLVLRTALNSVHTYTSVFLEWLLRVQSNPLTVKQHCDLVKLVSLYTKPVKNVNSNENKIFSVNDLIEKTQDQSQWSLAFGQENWKDIPIGSAM